MKVVELGSALLESEPKYLSTQITDGTLNASEITLLMEVQQTDHHLFCVAVRQALRWVKLARDANLIRPEVTRVIDEHQDRWIELRDMVEHGDKYLAGKGQRQHEYSSKAFDGLLNLTPHMSVRTGGKVQGEFGDGRKVDMADVYSIGGRLDVRIAVNEFTRLLSCRFKIVPVNVQTSNVKSV